MKLDELVIHSRSRANLEHYLQQPTHALMLTGVPGVGLGTIAQSLAKSIAGAEVILIQPTIHAKQKTANINIDDIRSINQLIGRRRSERLAIVIDDVDMMTNDAPQAFLKLLEEPSQNVHYILTAHDMTGIPTTIVSRTQIIPILPPDHMELEPLFNKSPVRLTADKRKKIAFMASGRSAETVRLLADETYYRAATESVEKAKQFLLGDTMERLEIITGITNRTLAMKLARDIANIIALTAAQAQNGHDISLKLSTIATVLDNLKQNGNVRAQMLFLALNI